MTLDELKEAAAQAVDIYDRYCLHDLTVDEYDIGKKLEVVRALLLEDDAAALERAKQFNARELLLVELYDELEQSHGKHVLISGRVMAFVERLRAMTP